MTNFSAPWTLTIGNDQNRYNSEIRDSKGRLIVLRAVMDVADLNIMSLLKSAPDLLAILRQCIVAYEEHRDAQPTGHLWPDPNHIHNARRAVAMAEGGEDAAAHLNHDAHRAWAKRLTDEQLTHALYEMRDRGAAVAYYDAGEFQTMFDGKELDDVEVWMEDNRDALEEAMCESAREFFRSDFGV